MRLDYLSIFPQYLEVLSLSLLGKAQEQGLLQVQVHDLRNWTTDRHRTVDDAPLGGGAGMVMKPDVWGNALDEVLSSQLPDAPQAQRVLLIPTPAGEVFNQRLAHELAKADQLVFACGRYEGIDARVAEYYAQQPGVRVLEVSIGDYVLNGGEVAALVITEAIARLLPGVVGNPESLTEESHEQGLLEYPSYTRPARWRDLVVPEVLLSGHHANIARWRREKSLIRTALRRKDLLAKLPADQLSAQDREIILQAQHQVKDQENATGEVAGD